MRNLIKIILWVSIITNITLILLFIEEPKQVIDTEKIDSLQHINDSLNNKRDSVIKEIDTIFVLLNNNNIKYETQVNNIISNSTYADYCYFSNYLKRRFDSNISNLVEAN